MREGQDVLIVGSGPIGIACARRLAEGGLRVTVLEAGSAITDPPGSHLRNQAQFQHHPDTFFTAVGRHLVPLHDRTGDVSLPGVADSALVGGQGVLWTNSCPRATGRERWDALSADAWERHYAAAEALLQVDLDPAAASRTGQGVRARLQPVLAEHGRTLCALPLSGRVLPDGRIHFAAPFDMLEAASPAARDRIVVRPVTRAVRQRTRGSRVTGVEVEGPEGGASLEAAVVLVAGGALATPRLLHRSGIRPKALGRGVFFHALLFGQALLDPGIYPPPREADIAPRLCILPTPEAPWHLQILRDTSPLQAAQAVENPHRLVEFQAYLPVAPRDANTLLMDDGGRAEFRFMLSANDREQMRAMEADVHALAGRLGRWRGGCEPVWVPHGAAHLMGTCRMDRADWEGVTDREGRVHGFDNLYLATLGLIPAPVAVNPTLTAVAVALQTCEAIAA